ncbi:MAG: Mur ligase domain-containing protein, partial [Planctomycetota bacterium]|nr:Mur ligase domain-containing protein [Planctomycetota bacterium]
MIHRTASQSSTSASPDPASGLVPGLPQHLHLVGAGGAGLSGAAKLLLARGHTISGHDREASPFTLALT